MTNTIVTWLWPGTGLSRRSFEPHHVEVLASMARRHGFKGRIVCLNDGPPGDKTVEWMPTPPEAAALGKLRSPEGDRFPACYRRLWMFSEAAKVLGDKVLLLDVDLVILRDLTPLFDYSEPFVGWLPLRDWGSKRRIGGGIYLMQPGAHTEVWESFKGFESAQIAKRAGYRGSDQAWMSYKLAEKVPIYPKDSGIYSIRDLRNPEIVPSDARLVQMNGPIKPWESKLSWVKAHWR